VLSMRVRLGTLMAWGKPNDMNSLRQWINDLKNSLSHVNKLALLLFTSPRPPLPTYPSTCARSRASLVPGIAIGPPPWHYCWRTKAQFWRFIVMRRVNWTRISSEAAAFFHIGASIDG